MSTEQITLFASLLTLGGVMVSIAWGTVQHHWTEADRMRAAAKLEEDRMILAAELEHRRNDTARALEAHLESRAVEIREELEKAAAKLVLQQAALTNRVEATHSLASDAVKKIGLTEAKVEANVTMTQEAIAALETNAVLTQEAVAAAHDAYKEANNVNLKIAAINEASLAEAKADKPMMQGIVNTGDDTNKRVRRVEDATVAEKRVVNERLEKIEDSLG